MIRRLAERSIKQIMLGVALVPALLMFLLLTPYSLYQRAQDSEQALNQQGKLLVTQLASASEYALVSGNTDYLNDIIQDLAQHPDVFSIAILDNRASPIAQIGARQAHAESLLHFEAPVLRYITPINTLSMIEGISTNTQRDAQHHPQHTIGTVEVYLSRSGIQHDQKQIIVGGTVLALIALLISGWVGVRMGRYLLGPIQAVIAGVTRIREGQYQPSINVTQENELGQLAADTNQLAQELEEAKRRVENQVFALTQAREEADRANASKTEFLALLSHEIRSPLNSAYGGLQLLAQSELNTVQRRYLSLALQCSELMNRLTDDILDFSRIEAGKMRITKQPCNLNEFVDFIRVTFELQAKDKSIDFTVTYEKMAPVQTDWIKTDPKRLQQIVINLVSNALKFTQQGSVRVHVSTSRRKAGHIDLQVSVEDTGVGIPTEKLQSIFDLFTQAHPPETRSYGGAGLGLCIAKRLTELLGGAITVWSREGLGSTFLLELPVRETLPQTSRPEANALIALPNHHRILVVEDDVLSQAAIIGLLKQVDIAADIANSGTQAFKLFKENPYDLVFIDCYMPQMNGFELAKQIRQYENTTRHNQRTPLVAITASALPETQEKCYAAGMDDFIAKPYRKFELYKRIAAIKNTGKILQQLQNHEKESMQ